MEPIIYKSFTIQEDFRNPYRNKSEFNSANPEFMFYRTNDGICHDANWDGETYRYTGNCTWADGISEAKDQIDEWEEQNADDLRLYEKERKA